MKKIIFIMLVISGIFTSCHNGKWEFPDYEYTAVYFAYQTPVRTIVLGDDYYDTTLDNEHKCQILATMGGVYDNKNNVEISFRVDNSLCDNISFDAAGNNKVMAMPSNYYSLSSSDKMIIEKGKIMGGVTVQLTDAFFADPLSLKHTYVIPLLMTGVKNADRILSGTAIEDNASRYNSEAWDPAPKDYILYAIKYINPYHATFLRRGTDVITGSINKTVVRQKEFVEKDEVISTFSRSLNTVELPLEIADSEGRNIECKVLLTFDNSGNCTVSSGTDGITMSGSGKFESKGEKNSWGNKDRDAIYLTYNINFGDFQYATTDVLVYRDRGIMVETFTPRLK